MSVFLVAWKAGVTVSQLFQWCKAYTEGLLVAVGANEHVVPESDLQDAIKRIKQLEAALGRKTLENHSHGGGKLREKKNVDCALAAVAWGRPLRMVCSTIGVARTHLVALLTGPDDWMDLRTTRSRSNDTQLMKDVRQVIHRLGRYGYRRV